MVREHNERCKDCKKHVYELLTSIFGEVKENYNIQLSNKPGSFRKSPYYSDLKEIYASLQNFRGHKKFIRSKKIPNFDFYIIDYQLNVEFDESQHFTAPRKLTLNGYPEKLKLGFDRQRWVKLCETHDKKDNDPIYRDEQRAWYDTLRDFAPSLLNHRPTIRLYSKDQIWCDLDSNNEADQEKFKNILKTKVYNYKKTILTKNPEYMNKKLLLADKHKRRLFKTNDDSHIQIFFNELGNLLAHKITSETEKIPLDLSLEKIGVKFLNLKDQSAQKMINYLVTPEMEIERIFNNLRYKYLESIYLSGLDNPQEYITANCNNAFQSLAGISVYQGGTKDRKDNDDFWKEAGFKNPSITGITFETERNELKFILNYARNLEKIDNGRFYAELIAIKPGFHEIYIHPDYFDEKTIPSANGERSTVFRLLRGVGSLETSNINELDRFPPEINGKSYLTYASCNITEGPFVSRKSMKISYFDEIRKIRSQDDLNELENNFNILDYYHKDINSPKDLKKILKDAEKFKGFVSLL